MSNYGIYCLFSCALCFVSTPKIQTVNNQTFENKENHGNVNFYVSSLLIGLCITYLSLRALILLSFSIIIAQFDAADLFFDDLYSD